MRIRLGYAWQGHAVRDVVDVDEVTGRRLLREGKGQLAGDRTLFDAHEDAERDIATKNVSDDVTPNPPARVDVDPPAPSPPADDPLDPDKLAVKTAAELRALAHELGIEVGAFLSKSKILALFEKARAARGSEPPENEGATP